MMKLIDYIKEYYSGHIDKKEMKEVLKKAGKDLIQEIHKETNGSKELVTRILAIVKNFFGGIKS